MILNLAEFITPLIELKTSFKNSIELEQGTSKISRRQFEVMFGSV